MQRFLLERRIRDVHDRVVRAREELAVIDEQVRAVTEAAEEARVRSLVARDFAQAFEQVDCILAPTAPNTAFAIGEKADDPVAMYLNDVFTVTVNMAGLPGISVPGGLDTQGLPLGLHVTRNWHSAPVWYSAWFGATRLRQ